MSGFRVSKLEDGLWSIGASYFSKKLQAAARNVPGVHWDSDLRAYVGYVDAIEPMVEQLREMGLKTDSAPKSKREWPHNLLVSYDSARDYQKEGIDFLVNQVGSGALLADDMGVGKSFQATKAARALRRKTVIVCPAHVRGVWERPKELDDLGGELAKWWPKAKVFAPYGLKTGRIPAKTDVVVIHYDIVHAWVEELLDWSDGDLTIVFDEAHILLNPNSRRSKACKELAHAALGRIALTGTPPTDRVRDLFNIVDTISPDRFGSFFGGTSTASRT
jgi:SNF2 family DNA or RNA helicase